jgi:uncharacterized protein
MSMALTTLTFAATGHFFDATILKLFLFGLPALALGLWTGNKLYGKLDDAAFRKVILVLLLFAGLSLVVPGLFRWFT